MLWNDITPNDMAKNDKNWGISKKLTIKATCKIACDACGQKFKEKKGVGH